MTSISAYRLHRSLRSILPAVLGLVRIAGVGVVLFLATRGRWEQELSTRLLAITGLSFAWLLATGTFGLGRLRADDWPVAPVLSLALAVRLLLVHPGNSEIRVYLPSVTFDGGWLEDKHSVIYAGW